MFIAPYSATWLSDALHHVDDDDVDDDDDDIDDVDDNDDYL